MARIAGAEKRVAAGVLGIFFGALGVHKFVLGYTKEGLIMLGATLLTLGFASPLVGLIGLIESILYLVKTDEDFVATYVQAHRGWF